MKKLSYLIGLLLASTWLQAQTIPCDINYLTREDTVYTGQHVKDTACIQIDLVATFVIEGGASYEAIIGGTGGGFLGNNANPSNFYPVYSPATPNVAAIERFGSHPVNLYTGLASVQIPLFDIQAGPIRVPISLNYHGSGVKVGEVASWVGMSWALNAGGNISRSLNGRPDEYLASFLEKGVRNNYNLSNPATCLEDRGDLQRLFNNQADTGGDMFSYNTPSTSGKFVLVPQSTQVVTVPSDKVQISYSRIDRTYLSEFKLRDENGLLYTFKDRETATTTTPNSTSSSTTAWLLNTIEGHAPNQRIEFVYETASLSYASDYQESQILTDQVSCQIQPVSEGLGQIVSSFVETSQTTQQLKEIRFPTGKIEFIRGTQNREDLSNNQFLDQIKLYSFRPATNDFQLVRSVDLEYEYLTNNDNNSKRLFLKEVRLLNRDSNLEGKYVLAYNGTSLPPLESRARDWWGYYNGQNTNQTLIPAQTVSADYAGGTVTEQVGGANREPDAASMQARILTQISYPTGGYTTFEYEPHQYLDGSTPKIAGGLRLKKMQTYASGGSSPIVKRYEYGEAASGYGRLGAWIRPTALFNTQLFANRSGCVGGGDASYRQRIFTTNYTMPLLPFDGSPVLYKEVVEYEGESSTAIGKTLYRFRDDRPDVLLASGGSNGGRFWLQSYHWDRGQLTQKEVYTQGGTLQYKQIIDFTNVVFGTTPFLYGVLPYQQTVRTGYQDLPCSAHPNDFVLPVGSYSLAIGNTKPIRTREYVYHNGNTSDYQYKETETDYNNFHYFPTETRTLASGGETLIERFSYPQDYTGTLSSSGNAGGWRRLIERNRYTPIEQVSLRKKSPSDTNPQVIGGTLTTYTVSNDEPVTDKIFSLEVGASGDYLYQSDFSFATTNGSGAVLANAKYVQQVHLSQYDADNNLTQWAGKDGITRGLTWQTYVHNYTNPSTTIRLSLLNTETTGVGTSVAQTTSYQYGLALLGIDQRTDPSGRNSFYFYDNYGRLQRVTDHESKVVAQYSYGYQTGVGSSNRILSETPRVAMSSVIGDHTQVQRSSQHFDGLGRPEQTVLWNGIPSAAKDLISAYTTYDANGRVQRNYLIHPSDQATGGLITTNQSQAQAFYGDTHPYTEIQYEASPLSKVTTQFGAGQAWRGATPKAVQTTYANVNGVWRFKATSSGIDRSSNYASGDILATTTTDEQGHEVITYTDLEGRVIQKAVQESAGNYLRTGYAYDDFGRLKYVIQPELFAWFGANTTLSESDQVFKNFAFGYEYDREGRMIAKHVPGADWTETVYDNFDRAVMSRTALQKQLGKWSFQKYDALNRMVLSGEKTESSDRSTLQTQADAATGHHEERNTTVPVYYSLSNSYPTVAEADLRNISYFDNYTDWLASGMGFDANNAYHAQYTNATGLATGSKTRNSENQNWLVAAQYYDHRKRAIQTFTHNLYGQVERTDIEYSFVGEILKTRELKRNQAGTTTTKLKTYTYDHVGRKATCQLDLGNINNQTIAKSEYDAIGRMKRKTFLPNGTFTTGGVKDYIIRPNPDGTVTQNNVQDIAKKSVTLQPNLLIDAQNIGSYLAQIDANATGGTPLNGLQKIDYQWHVRGWLQGINLDNSQTPVPNASEGDLFSYKLDYETAGFYDGNIGKQSWHNGAIERNYTFTYDNTNRLKSATYGGISGENYSIPSINYDRNGNITNLQRNGKIGSGFGLIDNLSYSYNGNRLNQITDAVSGNHNVDFVQRGGANYTFYNDGSLKSDANEQIENIVYDSFLDQPTQIQLTDGRTINHYYDGGGSLLRTVYSNGEYWEYTNGLIYRNGQSYQWNDDEGRILYQNGAFLYEFAYSDHLGNTRISFKENNGQLEKVAETSFDPTGVILKDLGQQNATQNRWELQGKESEKTFGLNRINFGARTFNPTTVVWDRIDKMVEKYYSHSPYTYALNNPAMFNDFDGNDLDPTRLKGADNIRGFRDLLRTDEGKAFIGQFVKAGTTVKVTVDGRTEIFKFDKDGSRKNDLLMIASVSFNEKGTIDTREGTSTSFERNTFEREIGEDGQYDINKGVTFLVRVEKTLSDAKSANTMAHEFLVHVDQDIQRAQRLQKLMSDGKIKPGTDEYFEKLRDIRRSAIADHSKMVQGQIPKYINITAQLDKLRNTKQFQQLYEKDVKDRKNNPD
jgi:RHS repeat-associated protein